MSAIQRNLVLDALLGVAVGDALGVPVEFRSRRALAAGPVIDMRAYGSHNQPAGTWSDDSSLTFCLAEMLCGEYDLQNLASKFVNWQDHGYWSAHGRVFDIGLATADALHKLRTGCRPEQAGGADEWSNGNGSLMRILPLVFYIQHMEIEERFRHVRDVSSLTHRHIRSILGCFLYTEYARFLILGSSKWEALHLLRTEVNDFLLNESGCPLQEVDRYHRILLNRVSIYEISALEKLTEDEVNSSGYVVSTLEASLWCLLKTESYTDAVLRAVNMGEDTDTTAAVTGGLAGLIYGSESIPSDWLETLARRSDIEDLAKRLHQRLLSSQQQHNKAKADENA